MKTLTTEEIRQRQNEKAERAVEILKKRLSKPELIEFAFCYGEVAVLTFWKRLKKEAGIG